jgi:hypothetical protein
LRQSELGSIHLSISDSVGTLENRLFAVESNLGWTRKVVRGFTPTFQEPDSRARRSTRAEPFDANVAVME